MNKIVVDSQIPERTVRYIVTQLQVALGDTLSIWVEKSTEKLGIGTQSPQDFTLHIDFYEITTGISSEHEIADIHKDSGDFILNVTNCLN